MTPHREGCLVCGMELVYLTTSEPMACALCGRTCDSNARCSAGHFVCDQCHRADALDVIERFCSSTDGKDPIEMSLILMRHPSVNMHGPEHHFLVPAVLLAAYYNAKGEPGRRSEAVRKARKRAETVPGGQCGLAGDCGAAVGAGIFVSVALGATPLSRDEWRLANLMTAQALKIIAEHGGPRCCKRNSFLAIRTAVRFSKTKLGVTMRAKKPVCRFSPMNKECLGKECPFNSGNQ